MKNELTWAWQSIRLSKVSPLQLAWLVILSLLTAVLDSLGLSVFLPLLIYLEGGAAALATRLPGPFDRIYALVAKDIAGYELIAILGVAIALLCVRYLVSFVQQKLSIDMAARAIATLRRRIHQTFLESDLSYHVQRHAGSRYTAVFTYAQQVGGTIMMLAQLLVAILVCSAYALLLLYVSPIMTIAALPVLWLVIFAYRWLLIRSKQASTEHNLHTATLNDELMEHLQGIRPIKLHNCEIPMADALAATTWKNLSLYSRVLMLQAVIGATITPILLIAGAALVYVSLAWFNVGLAVLGTFSVVLFRLLPLMGSLNTLRASLHAYAPSVELYQKALREAEAERTIVSGARPFTGIDREILFDRVRFTYQNTIVAALDGVSLNIPARRVVAIVGRSGSGKSTITDLLARLYDPAAGQITIDGVSLRAFDLRSLRESVALVSQDSFLFDTSVRDNVSLGLAAPLDDKALEAVLQQAHALEFVQALAGGFDARVGERGVKLSGGQRQRLTLARGLARKPALLILDEPTSALDSESEKAIQEALDELRGKITMVIVAHRFATIRNADLIHLLVDGKVVASGTHELLRRDNELYRNLSELQAA